MRNVRNRNYSAYHLAASEKFSGSVKRTEAELTAILLGLAKAGAPKTVLVRGVRLGYRSAERHIRRTLERGLLLEDHGMLHLSEKGAQFLAEFKKYRKLERQYWEKLEAIKEIAPAFKPTDSVGETHS